MLIPIGTAKRIRSWPFVTIGLIVANLIIYMISSTVLNRQIARIEMLRQRMWQIEKEYLPAGSYFDSWQFMSGETIENRDQQVLNGEIIPSDSYDYQVWEGLYLEYKERREHLVFEQWGFIPARFNLFRIVTSIFLHGGLMHLLGNMLFLWIAGANLEGEVGWKTYLLLYLVFGLAASLFHYGLDPSSEVPTIGASGAIAGLMGAFLMRFYKTKIVFLFIFFMIYKVFTKKFRIPAYICLSLWFLDQFISARYASDAGVAFGAHVGGFIIGACIMVVLHMAEILPPLNPAGDEDEDYLKNSRKMVKHLNNKQEIIQNATVENLPALLAIVRVEPENIDAQLALARMQFESGALEDCAVSYNIALSHILCEPQEDRLNEVYREMKNRKLFKLLSRENIVRLVQVFLKTNQFDDAVRLCVLYVMKYPKDPQRPQILYQAYRIYKDHLHDETRARKAAMLLKNEYPHLLKSGSKS